MKSAEHQISGCPTQIFLTLTIVLHLQPHTQRLQDALRVRDTNPGELAARGLQGKDFRVPGSLLAVTTRTLIYNCNTPIRTNRFSGTHEWPAPDRISKVQMSLSVKCFTAGISQLSPIAGRMEMPGISPDTVLLFPTPSAYPVIAVFHGASLVLPQEDITRLKSLDLSH